MIIGYTTGVWDLLHIGHINILKNCKSMCDKLIVGVSTDEIIQKVKNKKPTIPFEERCEILKSISYVDVVVPQENYENKFEPWERYKFDIMFVGDDWFNTNKWKGLEKQFDKKGVRIVYFPYTKGTSSTLINKILEKQRVS